MNRDHAPIVRDRIGRTIYRIRQEAEFLNFLVTEYPDCANDRDREFLTKIETILEKDNGRDCQG